MGWGGGGYFLYFLPALHQIYVIVLFESIFLKVICPILGTQKATSPPPPLFSSTLELHRRNFCEKFRKICTNIIWELPFSRKIWKQWMRGKVRKYERKMCSSLIYSIHNRPQQINLPPRLSHDFYNSWFSFIYTKSLFYNLNINSLLMNQIHSVNT